jgi:hypothetical protein
MRKNIKLLIIYTILLGLSSSSAYGENKKLAQTGMKFLSVSVDARISSLSGANAALEGASTSLLYNPAGMANMSGFANVALGQVTWIADIRYLFGTTSFSFEEGRYGVFGISFVSVDYGEFKGTIRSDNEQGFLDTGTFSPTAFAVGLGYAKALSLKFSVGGQVKYVYQDLQGGILGFNTEEQPQGESFDMDVIAFDFGIIYKTGFNSLNFGMSVRNFARELKYIEESFQIPLTFKLGLSMNMIDFSSINPDVHSLILAVDASHPRDFTEQLDIGIEYIFLKSFALRFGYTFPTDEQGVSLGAGINQNFGSFGLAIDYAYTSFGIFNDIHRFTLQFEL